MLGITDPTRKAGLAAKTRSKKQKELTPEELRQAWYEQLTDGRTRCAGQGMGQGRSRPATR